jgi:KipI family sensor histidine kinase inhibitor
MHYSRYGEDGIRIGFGDSIDPQVSESVRRTTLFLKASQLPEIIDVVPSFKSCLIHFDVRLTTAERLILILKKLGAQSGTLNIPDPVTHEIPVEYGGEKGPDLEFVAAYAGIGAEEIIDIHTSTLYTVFAVGFMPGFPYLGILDKRIFAPRLETPRVKVPKGSVGLAQLQTGIYPFDSPGGWRIIGKTTVPLFNAQKEPYSLLQIGDKVKFFRT